MNLIGIVKVLENKRLECWEYTFEPAEDWTAHNPVSHPELMFVPFDTKEEAIREGKKFAQYIGAEFVNAKEEEYVKNFKRC